MKPDLVTARNPSFCTIRATTPRGARWLDANLAKRLAGHGPASVFPVDHRYINRIIETAVAEGLIVQDQDTERFAYAGTDQ